jgi:predicted 3-demethylubiquinone-9 3-methyltransferase (glyoxalase superfamily)
MEKITPFLWFDSQAEEAAKFYTSVFKNSKIAAITRYDDTSSQAAGRPSGSVMTVAFELEGQSFTALNGGPVFKFTEAISFVVSCKTQAEIDELWKRLSEGGAQGQCGWLKDRYGVSWQIVPANLGELLSGSGPDAQRSQRVMQALLKMTKLDLAALQRAYEGR